VYPSCDKIETQQKYRETPGDKRCEYDHHGREITHSSRVCIPYDEIESYERYDSSEHESQRCSPHEIIRLEHTITDRGHEIQEQHSEENCRSYDEQCTTSRDEEPGDTNSKDDDCGDYPQIESIDKCFPVSWIHRHLPYSCGKNSQIRCDREEQRIL